MRFIGSRFRLEFLGICFYIVQEVVAAHGGQVAVQSTVGAGTIFTILLPLVGP